MPCPGPAPASAACGGRGGEWGPRTIPPLLTSLSAGHAEDIFYSISSGDPHGYFSIDSASGQLRTSLPLDHEAQPVLTLDVQARSGSPPAYSNTRVKISVSDVNDNVPAFPAPSDSILLPEATEPGTTVYTLQAEDRDSGANGQVHFELVSGGEGTFSVERSSGAVRLLGALQYDASAAYGLAIVARDSGVPQLSSTFTLLVHVQAEHDHGPIFDTLTYRVEVQEGVPVSTRFLQVRALARDTPAVPLTYHLRADGDAASFGIVPESGWLYVKSALDRETRDLYVLTVLASTGGSGAGEARKTGTSTVRISITDENDNSPRLSEERYFFTVPENQAPGSSVGRVTASDRDAGQNSRLTYRLLQHDPSFLIHAQTGELPPGLGPAARKAWGRSEVMWARPVPRHSSCRSSAGLPSSTPEHRLLSKVASGLSCVPTSPLQGSSAPSGAWTGSSSPATSSW